MSDTYPLGGFASKLTGVHRRLKKHSKTSRIDRLPRIQVGRALVRTGPSA